MIKVDAAEPAKEYDVETQKMLQTIFFKKNLHKHAEIVDALSSSNVNMAQRLAHNLKGSAGQIGKRKLAEAAENIEALLKTHNDAGHDKLCSLEDALQLLKTELTFALNDLNSATDSLRKEKDTIDKSQALVLFEKLKLILSNSDPECLDLLDELSVFPGTEKLINQIEDFDLNAAQETLSDLIAEWRERGG